MSNDFMFHSVIRVTCFRFIWPGKVSTVFSRMGRKCFRQFGAVFVRQLYSSYSNKSERTRYWRDRRDMARDATLPWQPVWLITEYIINFIRTELDEIRSRGVIEELSEPNRVW